MTVKKYIKEIAARSCLPRKERNRIKKDLGDEIFSAIERGKSAEEVMERMGDADKVAASLFENFVDIPSRPFREYKSQKTLFGLPLIHIIRGNYSSPVSHIRTVKTRGVNIGGRYSSSHLALPTACGVFAFGPKAKGIIAVGNFSGGIISIGNITAGVISLGNVSAGLVTVGNVALGALLALGNAVAGALSAGNAAYGYASAGNVARGEFALGKFANGKYSLSVSDLSGQMERVRGFVDGLEAPRPIKIFFECIEKTIDLFRAPSTAVPIIIVSATAICGVILALHLFIGKLLENGLRDD